MKTQSKEYILVIEGSVPSPSLSMGSTLTTSLCLLCRQLYRHGHFGHSDRYCKILQTKRREVVRVCPTDNEGGTYPSITNICIFFDTEILLTEFVHKILQKHAEILILIVHEHTEILFEKL